MKITRERSCALKVRIAPAIRNILLTPVLVLTIGFSAVFAQGYGGSSSSGPGQKIELGAFYGWQFGGNLTGIDVEVDVKNSPNYGVFLDIPLKGIAQLELLYNRQDTGRWQQQRKTI